MKGFRAWLLALLALMFAAPAVASERILSFHSHISVEQSGSMTVREVITVNAEGRKIRRGIYRDFPTTYKDRLGNRYQVAFQIVSVRRDGIPEDFHTKKLDNGIRTYFGNKDRYLNPGVYEYEFTYRTSRQLGFFEDHDELYWNVTGNGWDFSIDLASAAVRLPASIRTPDIHVEGYTGAYGGKGQDYEASVDNDGLARIVTTHALAPRQGLTVVVSYPKGHVHEPTAQEQLGFLLSDNRPLVIFGIGLLVILVYYLLVWQRVGRDQEAGVIIPLYYPPKGFSPASMRFIRNRGYDDKTFATALINLAVKGIVKLNEKKNKVFTVKQNDKAPNVELAAGEKALLDKLLPRSGSLTLEQSNHSRIAEAIKAHRNSLKRNYEKIYFVRNRGWIVPGAIISIITVFVALLNAEGSVAPPAFFLMFWLSIWSTVVFYLFANAYRTWRSGNFGAALHATFFAAVFGFFEVFAIIAFIQFTSISILIGLLLVIGLNIVFYNLLHADTRAGRRLMDQAEGFRLYLNVAEGDELKMAGGPNMTTHLFEMYLPYALALDVEQRWAERFASVFADLERKGTPYSPVWYHGSHWHSHNLAGFTDSIGSSLSSAISSSSRAPGSSSGGGGGGFSGGGGGGGGGGGW